MVSIFGAGTITLSHKEAQKAQRDSLKSLVLFVLLCGFLLLAWCGNVDVDLLCSSASKYSPSKHVQTNQYDQHKNYDYRDNTDAAATATVIGHAGSSLVERRF